LQLSKVVGTPNESVSWALPAGCLAHMEVLQLEDDTPAAWLTRKILAGCGPALRDFELKLSSQVLLFEDLPITLAHFISNHTSVTRLSLNVIAHLQLDPTEAALTEFYETLQRLPALERLELGLPITTTISKPCLEGFLESCPDLLWFSLTSGPSRSNRLELALPFLDLLEILRPRPQMRQLPISVDISEMPDAAYRAAFEAHQYSPIQLTLEDTASIEAVESFGTIVTELLPNVRRLVTRDESIIRVWFDNYWAGLLDPF
jgi:hypothetical protein